MFITSQIYFQNSFTAGFRANYNVNFVANLCRVISERISKINYYFVKLLTSGVHSILTVYNQSYICNRATHFWFK